MDLKRRSLDNNVIVPSIVSENTLQVWRRLPSQIRRDPSMVTFQTEDERMNGSQMFTESEANGINTIDNNSNNDEESVDYIVMKDLNHTEEDANDNKKKSADDESTSEELKATIDVQQQLPSNNNVKRVKLYKRVLLIIFWIFIVAVLMSTNEKYPFKKLLVIPQNASKSFLLPNNPSGDFKIKLRGAFATSNNNSTNTNYLFVQPHIVTKSMITEEILPLWNIPLLPHGSFETANVTYTSRIFEITNSMLDILNQPGTAMYLNMTTNTEQDLTIELNYNSIVIDIKLGTLLAACILMSFYCILMWEIFHRTFAAILCSTLSLTVLACFNDRPNMHEIVEWLNMELLTLIFCMMIIVGVLTETGVFDYLSVVAFEVSRGKVWPMISCLCILTCLVSGVLDNMTTVLLMTPVAIRLCEDMGIDPVPVIMGIIVHANIGGILTPIGDPVSIIIYSNPYLIEHNITFLKFVSHAIPGVILVVLQSLFYMRVVFRNKKTLRLNEPKEIKELRRDILVWQRAANSISLFSKDAGLVREKIKDKLKVLKYCLKEKLRSTKPANDAYVLTLEELKQKYPVKDKVMLFKTCCALIFILIAFVVQSFPGLRTLPLSWLALLGIIILLIVLDNSELEHLFHRIDWTTLLFLGATFVMMECVDRLGLFTWIGGKIQNIIMLVGEEYRLIVAILLILWVSAIISSVLESVPVTLLMVKLVVTLVSEKTLNLPLEPLVWALTFGPSLGGNGTIYGAASNIIAVGLSEQHGYKISFSRYFKIVFPMMFGQLLITSAYLTVAHIIYKWH